VVVTAGVFGAALAAAIGALWLYRVRTRGRAVQAVSA
jgi:hypothetical protein